MFKNIKILIFFFILFFSLDQNSREIGQTEITTEEGIEVYQKEKYYLLKKNVQIDSDKFSLSAEKVTAHFEKDLYDITEVYSEGNVLLESSNGTTVKGQKVDYDVKNEKIYIQGKQSFLTNNDFTMKSNENIKINNFLGQFELNGLNSELITSQVEIIGEKILGNFSEINGENIIKKLNAKDNNQVYIKTSNMEMYALEAKYDYNTNIIELFSKVKMCITIGKIHLLGSRCFSFA